MAGAPAAAFPSGFEGGHAAVLNALPGPVLVVDRAGVLAYLNPAAEQFFQGGRAALIGQPLARLIPPDSPILDLIDQVRRGGHSRRWERWRI